MCTTTHDDIQSSMGPGLPSLGTTGGSIFPKTLCIKSGENAWLSTIGLPRGSRVNVTLNSGTIEICGFPLPRGKSSVLSGNTDYFLQSWSGCTLTVDISRTVRWTKTSSTFHHFLEKQFLSPSRILVLDDTHCNAMTIANYSYRLQKGSSKQHFMVNLDTAGNAGVVCLYTMKGCVPPHHPLDHLPNHKQMFWAGTGREDFITAASSMKEMLSGGDKLVVYMNISACTDEDIKAIVGMLEMNQVLVFDDRRFFSLSCQLTGCDVSNLAPIVTGSRFVNVDTVAAESVLNNVFLQEYRTFHYDCTKGLAMAKFQKKLSDSLLPKDMEVRIQPYVDITDKEKNGVVFAAVSGFQEKLMSFWGFVIVDHKGRCHSIIPEQYARLLRLLFARQYLE